MLGENWVARSISGPPDPGNETAAQLGEAGGGKTNGKAGNLQAREYVRAGLCAIAKSGCPHASLIESRATERPPANLPKVASASQSRSVTVISNLHHESLIADRGAVSAPDAKRLPPVTFNPRLLPSRATLARKWPALKINRFTGRWRDDASGAPGADVASLLAFIGEGAR